MIRNKAKTLIKRFPRFLKISGLFNNRHWPEHVLNTLETKYRLRPTDMLRLWYIRERVKNGRYYTDVLSIYDIVKAREKKISIRSSTDLYANSDLLLYTGNIFWDGSLYLKSVSKYENN